MELISTDDFFILQPLQKGEDSLWCCKRTGQFQIRPSWDLAGQENPECFGIVWALYGKVTIHPDVPDRLILVRGCERIGEIPGRGLNRHAVYKVTDIVFVPLEPSSGSNVQLFNQLALKPCPKHHGGIIDDPDLNTAANGGNCKSSESSSSSSSNLAKSAFGKLPKIGGSLRTLASDTIKNTAGTANAIASQVKTPWKSNRTVSKIAERFERRILDEITKMFNDSFYFSLTGDITNSVQRLAQTSKNDDTVKEFSTRSWRTVDDRFFFNKALVQELIDLNDTRVDSWIVPFIQGFVEMQECPLGFADGDSFVDASGNILPSMSKSNYLDPTLNLPDFYTIILISRRSRHRAGTRYKRRGVDVEGHVANYVETEQILLYHHYALSFIQVRGSVPVFWSQPGYKYRPPPKLDRTPQEDEEAFKKHFDQELGIYGGPVVCVNLAERAGREKIISDAYLDNALAYDSTDLQFISFDFHEYCRGMHFENVSILLEALEGIIRDARYCWLDRHGVVCSQRGVLRVNCIDCLDRTNVVETSIARAVLETQLTKLGVVPPEQGLPDEAKVIFQELWANNGDALSRQYAGTNALKGDFTRTGERNLSGMMKDGVNSASRYYLNQFKDAYRQATIDILTGQLLSECSLMDELDKGVDKEIVDKERFAESAVDEDGAATADRVKALIEDCKKLLIPDLESVVGAWGLIDSDPVTGDPSQEDVDVIFILARDAYYVARYDDEVDKVTQYQRVALTDIEKIEFGLLDQPTFQLSFRSAQSKIEHHLRIHYRFPPPVPVVYYNEQTSSVVLSQGTNSPDCSGYFHMFRSTNLRFFNNLAVVIRTEEERIESLRNVSESLSLTMQLAGLVSTADVYMGKLDRKKSKVPDLHSNFNEAPIGPQRSGRSLVNPFVRGVVVGSKAFSNVTRNISRLNPINKLRASSSNTLKSEDSSYSDIGLADPAQDSVSNLCEDDGVSSIGSLSTEHCLVPPPPSEASPVSVRSPCTSSQPRPTTPTFLIGTESIEILEQDRRRLGESTTPQTSRKELSVMSLLSPNLGRRVRKISRSSEDLIGKSERFAEELRGGLSASLQKDINLVASQVEGGAAEAVEVVEVAANVIAHEVFNPLAKLTKGFQNVVLAKASQKADPDETGSGRVPPEISAVAVVRPDVDPVMIKIAESNSRTKVIML